MASQTTNLHLVKPTLSESGDVAIINSNMDTIDTAIKSDRDNLTKLNGGTAYATEVNPDNYTTTGVYHVALAAAYSPTGAVAYGMLMVYSHSSTYNQIFHGVGNDIYIRSKNNTTAWKDWKELASNVISFGDSSLSILQNLTNNWTTKVPNDNATHLVRVYASNTYYFGTISRYNTSYGSAVLNYYNGNSYMFYLNNGSVTQRRIMPDNEIYWTGTSISFTSIQGYGYVTNGAANIYLTFPVRRNFVNQSFTNATVSSFKFSLRGNSGFVDVFSSETTEFVGTSGYTFTATTRNDNSCLHIIIVKTSAFTNVTNNTPIHARGNLTITFT